MEDIQHELSTLSIGLDKARDITSSTRDQVITSTAAVRMDIKKASNEASNNFLLVQKTFTTHIGLILGKVAQLPELAYKT